MSNLKTFIQSMPAKEREQFAARAGTTVGTLNQMLYGGKRVELGFADALVAVACGSLKLDDLPLTDRAAQQRAIREGAQSDTPEPTPPAAQEVA